MTNFKAGLAICALLAFVDVAGVAGAGMDDAPPVVIWASGGLLGLATFAFLPAAAKHHGRALWGVIATRGASGLLGVPAYFVDSVPTWALIGTTVAIALTVLALGLVLPDARRAGRAEVRTA